MKKITKTFSMLVFVCLLSTILIVPALAAPSAPQQAAQSADVPGFRLVMGDSYTLASGDSLPMNLVVMGGNANLKSESTVIGDVILLGGNLRADGTIQGDVIILGGNADLGDTAVVNGDIDVVGGNLKRSQGAVVKGSVEEGPMDIVVSPFNGGVGPFDLRLDRPTDWFGANFGNPVTSLLWLIARSFIWMVVAVLAVLFLATPINRVGLAATQQPLAAGGVGCLTTVVAPIILVLLAITIICSPLSVLGVIVLVVAWAYGIIALGCEAGKKLAQLFKKEWALAISAALGTFLLTLVINSVGQFVPCIGWVIPLLAGCLGIGAVLLTRFGTRSYPAYAAVADFTTPGSSQAQLDAFQGDLPLPPSESTMDDSGNP